MYQGLKRRWRLKSKHPLVAMVAFDLDGDGATELLTGWANGKVECRRSSAGEVVMRDCMTAPVAALALVPGEEGRAVAVAVDGEVRGRQHQSIQPLLINKLPTTRFVGMRRGSYRRTRPRRPRVLRSWRSS